ncbi:MAG TPA: LysE family translocator [Nevskiales bacterium]|nr:LysE family translocator [Nevskiales bacterium]
MILDTWLLFVPAAFALNMAPGPNNLLSVANAARFGFAASVLGGLGRLLAFALMIALTAVGLGTLLAASELAFQIVKWLGAAYLLYLGIKLWRAPAMTLPGASAAQTGTSVLALAQQEFLVAVGNPKAILIFTAFFPQFLSRDGSPLVEFALMGVTFLALELIAIALYALSGRQLAAVTRSARGLRLFNRMSGSALCGAGVLLLLSSRANAAT